MGQIVKKSFDYELLERVPLERVDSPSGRVYSIYGNSYPSVTTILNKTSDMGWLDDWKLRVGEDASERIMTQARNRGTAMHSIYERFLLNQDYRKKTMPVNLEQFSLVKPILEKSISKIYGVELPLYSKILKAAGTTDAVVRWENEQSILDFKTSKRPKKLKDIESYLIQTTFYSMMIEEMYGLEITQLVILMTVDHNPTQLFKISSSDYRPTVYKIMRKYNETIGSGT